MFSFLLTGACLLLEDFGYDALCSRSTGSATMQGTSEPTVGKRVAGGVQRVVLLRG